MANENENVLTVAYEGEDLVITGTGPAWPQVARWPGYTRAVRAIRDAQGLKARVGGARIVLGEGVEL